MQIKLFTLGGAFGMNSVSPFCFKLELLLKHLDLPHETIVEPDPRKAPKGKLPFIEINGAVFADSDIIARQLDDATDGGVFSKLTAEQRANGLAMTRMAEEHLYWIMVASRWLDDAWWPNVVDGFFSIAPAPLRPLISTLARRQVRKTYDLQGLGRHTQEEQRAFVRSDLQALQDAVGNKPFLLGASVSYFDFAVTSILVGIYDNRPKTWMTAIAEDYGELQRYVQRVQSEVGLFAA